ncbi:MAG: hypothetical protein ACTSUE_05010 [Promethearchaeota archaeon]
MDETAPTVEIFEKAAKQTYVQHNKTTELFKAVTIVDEDWIIANEIYSFCCCTFMWTKKNKIVIYLLLSKLVLTSDFFLKSF